MQRILVAFDGGEPAIKALHTAIDLARKFGATVAVVSVVPIHGGRFPMDPWDDTEVHARELAHARVILTDAGIEAEFIEPYGEPGPMIEKVVETGGYDTLVVGSRGLGAVSRLLQGSVSEHVATHSGATVVIAR